MVITAFKAKIGVKRKYRKACKKSALKLKFIIGMGSGTVNDTANPAIRNSYQLKNCEITSK